MALHLDIASKEQVQIGEDISIRVVSKQSGPGGKALMLVEVPADQKVMMRFGDEIRVTVREKTGRRVCMSFSAPREIAIERQRAADPENHVAHEGQIPKP